MASAAAALGLTSLALAGAGTAPAQAAVSDCPSGYFCAWPDDRATGSMFKTNASKATLGTWDNKLVKVVNRTSLIACLYDDPNYGRSQGYTTIEPDPIATNFSSDSGFSSVKLVRTAREYETAPYPGWYAATAPKLSGFGDMNADRRSDILVRDTVGRLWFLPGDDTGRLVGSGGWNALDALTRHGDFSRDGREDVIAREKSTGKLWLYPGRAGVLGARALVGSGGCNGMESILGVGDWSADGRPDLLASNGDWLSHYRGTGTGGLRVGDEITGGWWGLNGAL
ncbi:peptidase inhibitor family I36 protein [Streptomyces sp. SJL17-1]|uniref:peptidase inhibitor family I36 protein n=1 Tax=Streptomyces sp. SJL17-1 TaxID=2967223 RepID=UPI0029660D01|nr:peptidase inhibitor family I36 protein [Streptomyces sp. SJL17-1]